MFNLVKEGFKALSEYKLFIVSTCIAYFCMGVVIGQLLLN